MDLYRVVYVRMWRAGGSFSRLSAPSQLLWINLLTGPHTGMLPGLLINVGPWAIAETMLSAESPMGWTREDFLERFAELESAGMAVADWEDRLVLLPGALTLNPPANPNILKRWGRLFNTLPDCELTARYYSLLEATLAERKASFLGVFQEHFRRPSTELPTPEAVKKRAKRKATAKKPEEYLPKQLMEDWNEVCVPAGLLPVKGLGKRRYAKALGWCRDLKGREKAREVLTRLAASKRACGVNRDGWKATFDWLISSDQPWRAILEGQYDNRPAGKAKSGQSVTTEGNSYDQATARV